MKKTTTIGIFTQDKSGLWHYRCINGDVFTGANDAVQELGTCTPCHFWHAGTFCPILPNDTGESLESRWVEWRMAYDENAKLFVEKAEEFSQIQP